MTNGLSNKVVALPKRAKVISVALATAGLLEVLYGCAGSDRVDAFIEEKVGTTQSELRIIYGYQYIPGAAAYKPALSRCQLRRVISSISHFVPFI